MKGRAEGWVGVACAGGRRQKARKSQVHPRAPALCWRQADARVASAARPRDGSRGGGVPDYWLAEHSTRSVMKAEETGAVLQIVSWYVRTKPPLRRWDEGRIDPCQRTVIV